MRVCLIGPIPPFRGGIAKYCYALAQELEKRHELLLVSYRRQYPKILYGRKSQTDPAVEREQILARFARLTFDLDSVNPLSWRQTVEKIREFKPETVIIPWWVAYWTPMYLYLLWALKRRGIRVVVLCINVFEHEANPLKKFLTRLLLARADHLIVHSTQEMRQLQAFNPTATLRKQLLPLFTYDAAPCVRSDDKLHLLFFGFVRLYKGLDLLLEAVAILRERDISLKIAGEFWNGKDEYLRLMAKLGISDRVEITDRYVTDEEMGRFFAWADLIVLPYRRTLTSGVIATAYGYGKPVLATNVGGFSEVVMDGATGKLVEPGSARALAEGIEWFSNNRQVDFPGNIQTLAAEQMSWSSLVETIEVLGRQ